MITGAFLRLKCPAYPIRRRYDVTGVNEDFGTDDEFDEVRPELQTRRRALLLLALTAQMARAQDRGTSPADLDKDAAGDVRLPNGKKQQDEIVKAAHAQNLKEARELAALAKQFADDLEKSDRFVLSVSSLKQLDELERRTRRIRDRMKGYY